MSSTLVIRGREEINQTKKISFLAKSDNLHEYSQKQYEGIDSKDHLAVIYEKTINPGNSQRNSFAWNTEKRFSYVRFAKSVSKAVCAASSEFIQSKTIRFDLILSSTLVIRGREETSQTKKYLSMATDKT